MKNKKLAVILGAAILYLLLVSLLIFVESGSPNATITSFGTAVWYSLTTLTTVGYGDTYPVTAAGRVIGALFQLLSLGVLVTLIGTLFELLRGRWLPLVRLFFRRNRPWYIFADINERSQTIAKSLKNHDSKAEILFAGGDFSHEILTVGTRIAFTPQQLLAYQKQKGTACVFALSDDQSENDRLAKALRDEPCRVYAMSGYEPDRLTDQLILLNSCEITARLFWSRHPVTSPEETIVMIGDGRYADALLEQALLINVIDPSQHMTYCLIGDYRNFRRNHPYLDQVARVSCLTDQTDLSQAASEQEASKAFGDSLIFTEAPWNHDLDFLKTAGRIIFCGESVETSMDQVAQLKRFCPLTGEVFVRGAAPLDGITAFGTCEDIFTPELTMKTRLNETAMRLHKIYQASTPGASDWKELSGFLRRSNLASADHLPMKIRILTGRFDGNAAAASSNSPGLPAPQLIAQAAAAFEAAGEPDRDRFRRIEHERWSRFHILNNWQYAPERDNKRRLHPLLLPYDLLSPEDQKKDEYAWQLLSQLTETAEP